MIYVCENGCAWLFSKITIILCASNCLNYYVNQWKTQTTWILLQKTTVNPSLQQPPYYWDQKMYLVYFCTKSSATAWREEVCLVTQWTLLLCQVMNSYYQQNLWEIVDDFVGISLSILLFSWQLRVPFMSRTVQQSLTLRSFTWYSTSSIIQHILIWNVAVIQLSELTRDMGSMFL